MPLGLLAQASAGFYASAQPGEFNYGERQGDRRMRKALAAFLGSAYGDVVEAANCS